MSAPALQFLTPHWPVASRVRAAVTLRAGGVSPAPYASLNLASHVGDTPEAVAENRRRLRTALALPCEPLWLSQVHGTQLIDAEGPGAGALSAPPEADAAVAFHPGCVLAVLVADCLPVLLARRDGSAIAVAHAGWRGLAAGVVEAAVAALRAPPSQLCAWLGPAIGPAHFEVGEEVRCAFCERDSGATVAFVPNARGRWQCDLPALARRRLRALGLHAIHGEAPCTYAHPERFYSYRRERTTGRLAALLWIEP